MERYETLSKLAMGSQAAVYLCRDTHSNNVVAVKCYTQAHLLPQVLKSAIREATLLRSCRHRNIVQMLNSFRSDSGRVYVIQEYVPKPLASLVAGRPGKGPCMAWESIWNIAHQLLEAICYLHKSKIIHRDLKPSNLMMTNDGVLKVIGFNMARQERPGDGRLTPYIVSRFYRAPEVLVAAPYSYEVDVWAAGCILAELATGRPLFPGRSHIDQLQVVLQCFGRLPSRFMAACAELLANGVLLLPGEDHASQHGGLAGRLGSVPSDMLALIEACLQPDPLHRPTAEELLAMPCFRGRGLSHAVSTINGPVAAAPAAATAAALEPPSLSPTAPASGTPGHGLSRRSSLALGHEVGAAESADTAASGVQSAATATYETVDVDSVSDEGGSECSGTSPNLRRGITVGVPPAAPSSAVSPSGHQQQLGASPSATSPVKRAATSGLSSRGSGEKAAGLVRSERSGGRLKAIEIMEAARLAYLAQRQQADAEAAATAAAAAAASALQHPGTPRTARFATLLVADAGASGGEAGGGTESPRQRSAGEVKVTAAVAFSASPPRASAYTRRSLDIGVEGRVLAVAGGAHAQPRPDPTSPAASGGGGASPRARLASTSQRQLTGATSPTSRFGSLEAKQQQQQRGAGGQLGAGSAAAAAAAVSRGPNLYLGGDSRGDLILGLPASSSDGPRPATAASPQLHGPESGRSPTARKASFSRRLSSLSLTLLSVPDGGFGGLGLGSAGPTSSQELNQLTQQHGATAAGSNKSATASPTGSPLETRSNSNASVALLSPQPPADAHPLSARVLGRGPGGFGGDGASDTSDSSLTGAVGSAAAIPSTATPRTTKSDSLPTPIYTSVSEVFVPVPLRPPNGGGGGGGATRVAGQPSEDGTGSTFGPVGPAEPLVSPIAWRGRAVPLRRGVTAALPFAKEAGAGGGGAGPASPMGAAARRVPQRGSSHANLR